MMTASNLAIVFGPPLLRPRQETFDTICHTVTVNSLTEFMIENCNDILAAFPAL